MRMSLWACRAAVLAALLASVGCNDVITGLSCSESTPCGAGATCERGVCVYLDPDTGAAPEDAGKPDAGKPGKDAAVPGPDAGPKPDAGVVADTGPTDVGAGSDAGPDGGAGDVGAGLDAGLADAGPSCQPNEEWVDGDGCLQVFEVQVVVPTKSHGTVAVILTRKDSRTTSRVPTAVEAKWVRKKTQVGSSLLLTRTADQAVARFEGSWALEHSGEYEVKAAFDLNGSFLSDPESQKVLPAAHVVLSYEKADPDLFSGHYVYGQIGKITVAVDVVNVGLEKAELKDPVDRPAVLSVAGEADCGTQHCLPCSDTVARCLVLNTDFFHGGALGMEARRDTYDLDVKVKDDESSTASVATGLFVSRWARNAASPTAGMVAYAPLVVLSDGTVLAALSDRPPDPLGTAGTRELVAITPAGALIQGPKGSGSVRTLSVVEQGGMAHLALVTLNGAVTAEQATFDVWYGTYANGGFSALAPVNVGNGKQTRGVGVAWRAADLTNAPVLSFVGSEGGAEFAHAGLWPAGGAQYSRGTMTFRIDPNPPVLTALDRLLVGALDGKVYELREVTGAKVEKAAEWTGPGAPVVGMVKGSQLAALGVDNVLGKTLVFQEGASLSSLTTVLPLAFVATAQDLFISSPNALFTLPWGSTTPASEASGISMFLRHGLLVGASGAVYVVGESNIGVSGSTLVRRPAGAAQFAAPWKLTGMALGGAVLDCARTAPASTQGKLGLLHVPMRDGKIVTLVVDDPGPDVTPGAWPMVGHDGRRTYSFDGPLGCTP